MSNHGSFSGNPKTEWLVDDSGADRNMRLLKSIAEEQFVQDKFQELAVDLKLLRDDATIAELDAVIDRHLQF
ncbi:MAG: hypothetical protein KGL31_04490 [candidate division NC10 bacterium]|nr:hypothetical protein [candidate division NC10 bacterium]MDE2321160.1 hypothetical protein [candidate division NC10 bacterium]